MRFAIAILVSLLLAGCSQPIGVHTQSENPPPPSGSGPSSAWEGGDTTGNGGGETGLTFSIIGHLIVAAFDRLNKDESVDDPLTEEQIRALQKAVDETRIVVVQDQLYDRLGAPVDMVTDPDKDPSRAGRFITQVNETAFKKQLESGTVFRTIFHEYLRASRIPDDQAITLVRFYPFLDKLNQKFLTDSLRLRGLATVAGTQTVRTPVPQMSEFALKHRVQSRKVDLESDRRREALTYLVNLADRTGLALAEIDLYLSDLRSEKISTRREAAQLLRLLTESNDDARLLMMVALPTLIQVVADPDEAVGGQITGLLGRLGEPATARISQATLHPVPAVSIRAVRALGYSTHLSKPVVDKLFELYFRDWRIPEWEAVRQAIRAVLHNQKPSLSERLSKMEASADKFDLAKKQRETLEARAQETGFPVETEYDNLVKLRLLESGVSGLRTRRLRSFRTTTRFNPYLNHDVYDWDSLLNRPIWLDGSRDFIPDIFFMSQLRSHYLLQYYSKDAPVPLPTRDLRLLVDMSSFRAENYNNEIYYFASDGTFGWSLFAANKLGLGQYMRQAYAYHVLCSWGVQSHVPLPSPLNRQFVMP